MRNTNNREYKHEIPPKSSLFVAPSLILVVLSFLLVVFSVLPLATGAMPLTVNILPAKIFLTIEKGQSAETSISITNSNDFPIEISVETENFVPGVLPGDIEFVAPLEAEFSLANWIKIPKSFSLPAEEKKQIFFQIQVPKDATSGGYYAVVFFKPTAAASQGAGPLRIGTRVGTLVMLTVPGEISREAKIVKFSGPKFVNRGPINFEILVRNDGTAHFKTEGNILIKNWLGRKIASVAVEERIVLPRGSQILKASWPVGFLLGFYRADLTIWAEVGQPLTADFIFFALPVWEIFGLIVVLGFVIFGLKFLKKKFKIVRK